MKATVAVALVALLAASALARPVCHNITGTCLEQGFVCVSGEVVPHAQRCNGVEDCSDGTDEFLCEHEDHRPMFERTPEERHAAQQASCVNCNCAATAYDVTTGSPWMAYALIAPTDTTLMTGTGLNAGRACSSICSTKITLGFYKKNKICRGWLCCVRQRACQLCTTGVTGCASATTGSRCY